MTADERAALAAQLAPIRARAEAATPGPWYGTTVDSIGGGTIYDRLWSIATATIYNHDELTSNNPSARGPGYIDTDANAEFIAAARTDVPALLAIIDGQAKRLALAEKTIADAATALDVRGIPFGADMLAVWDRHIAEAKAVLRNYDAAKGAL